eukprot:m.1648932 g.1648932  ORF g.1648932 m.1648932 type:complete len:101 (-) comp81319_c0_seq1:212-514(-)
MTGTTCCKMTRPPAPVPLSWQHTDESASCNTQPAATEQYSSKSALGARTNTNPNLIETTRLAKTRDIHVFQQVTISVFQHVCFARVALFMNCSADSSRSI